MPVEPFGPIYPDLGTGVAKHRRAAAKAGSVREMAPWDRQAYGSAVLKAIATKNARLHMRPTPPETGGWYSPPSIARLLRYEKPIPMVGDPNWYFACKCRAVKCRCDYWGARENAVMKVK